jgi:cytidylate kinase
MPITIGHTFSPVFSVGFEQQNNLFVEQSKLLKELAEKSDCVIVGRCADYILKEFNPVRIRLFAELDARIERCRQRADKTEEYTDREIKQKINEVDKTRAKYYKFYTGRKWDDPLNYDFLINTTDKDIKKLVEDIASVI